MVLVQLGSQRTPRLKSVSLKSTSHNPELRPSSTFDIDLTGKNSVRGIPSLSVGDLTLTLVVIVSFFVSFSGTLESLVGTSLGGSLES